MRFLDRSKAGNTIWLFLSVTSFIWPSGLRLLRFLELMVCLVLYLSVMISSLVRETFVNAKKTLFLLCIVVWGQCLHILGKYYMLCGGWKIFWRLAKCWEIEEWTWCCDHRILRLIFIFSNIIHGEPKTVKCWFLICDYFKCFSKCGPYGEHSGVIDSNIIDCDGDRWV